MDFNSIELDIMRMALEINSMRTAECFPALSAKSMELSQRFAVEFERQKSLLGDTK